MESHTSDPDLTDWSNPMIGAFKPWHLIVLVLVLVLLFGAKRLPDAARSLGRSLRIIKAETKGLVDDDSNLAEKAEPQYGREPLRPSEIQHPPQPGQPYHAQPPFPGQQAQQPPAAPYVDPVQRTHDR